MNVVEKQHHERSVSHRLLESGAAALRDVVQGISQPRACPGNQLLHRFVCTHFRSGVRPFQEQPSSEAVEKMEKVVGGVWGRRGLLLEPRSPQNTPPPVLEFCAVL